MKKHIQRPLSIKKIILATLAVVVVLVVIFLVLDGIGKIKSAYYGYVTSQAYHKEYKNLQPALEGLGLSEGKDVVVSCSNEETATDRANVRKVLSCGLQTDNYVEITEANKQKILDSAKQLDELANKNGGKVQTNIDITFSKYVADISSGIDYYPDFGATFVRDNYLCEVHFNVAYSNPKTPAYSIQFGCNAPRVNQDDHYLPPLDAKTD